MTKTARDLGTWCRQEHGRHHLDACSVFCNNQFSHRKTSDDALLGPVQQIIDCSQSLGNKGCYGGSRTLAQKYVSENGIVSDAAYAYTAKDEVCRQVVQDKTKQCLRKGDISPAKSVTIDSNRLNLLEGTRMRS
mmetsp:Transcript_6670/g.5699  ORF Transcript_6670/g.5699 Transcript_6670/m.5699 type:complete len:134 (-) Transcript_6670:127-528(-)